MRGVCSFSIACDCGFADSLNPILPCTALSAAVNRGNSCRSDSLHAPKQGWHLGQWHRNRGPATQNQSNYIHPCAYYPTPTSSTAVFLRVPPAGAYSGTKSSSVVSSLNSISAECMSDWITDASNGAMDSWMIFVEDWSGRANESEITTCGKGQKQEARRKMGRCMTGLWESRRTDQEQVKGSHVSPCPRPWLFGLGRRSSPISP